MKRTRTIIVAAGVALVMVAAGCGSNQDSADENPGAAGSEQSAAEQSDSGDADTGSSEVEKAPSEASAAAPDSDAESTEPAADPAEEDFTCAGKSGDEVPTELVLALVPSGDAERLVESVKPLTDYLTDALGIPVTGVVSTNYAGAVEAMGAGQAQIGMLAPLPLIQACQKYGAKIVLQSVRYGSSTYHTQFMTNNPDKYCTISPPEPKASNDKYLNCNGTADAKTGPVGLEALKAITPDTKVALLDPGSTSGFIFPTLALINQGIDPDSGFQLVQLTAHDQSVLAVANGDVEVGVSFDDARDVVAKDMPDVGQKAVVFAYSAEIPNDGVAVSGDLTAEWQQKITKTLQDYAGTDEGKKVLGSIYQIDDLAPAEPASLGKVAEAVAKLGLTG